MGDAELSLVLRTRKCWRSAEAAKTDPYSVCSETIIWHLTFSVRHTLWEKSTKVSLADLLVEFSIRYLPLVPCSRACRRMCPRSCRGKSGACTSQSPRYGCGPHSPAGGCPVSNPWRIEELWWSAKTSQNVCPTVVKWMKLLSIYYEYNQTVRLHLIWWITIKTFITLKVRLKTPKSENPVKVDLWHFLYPLGLKIENQGLNTPLSNWAAQKQLSPK